MATTDLHCWLAPYDYYRDEGSTRYGLSRLAALIVQARREQPNTLLFDNGDLLQGNPLADMVARGHGLRPGELHPAFKALNVLKYDGATLGNHDFDYGLPFLERALSGAEFPYVCANVLHAQTGEPYFRAGTILERRLKDGSGQDHAVRIGLFGVAPPQIASWNKHQLDGRLVIADIVDTARKMAVSLRNSGADLVVALCHSGFGHGPHIEGEENAAAAVAGTSGIDVVIAGHSHRVFPDISFAELPGLDLAKGTLNGKPAVMPGFYGSHLGVIDLTLARVDGKIIVADGRAEARPLHGAPVPPDPVVVQAIAADHHATIEYCRQPVGVLKQPLDSYFATVAPSPLLALIADVQRHAVQTAIADEPELFDDHRNTALLVAIAPFKSGGRAGPDNYVTIDAGPVAIGNVADLYPFPDVIEVVAVSGADLREWLEMSASLFRQIQLARDHPQILIERDRHSYDFDVIHGISYTIDVTRPPRYRPGGTMIDPAAFRIADLKTAGKPVHDDDRFLVATNNYRASGGGGFPGMDGSHTVYRSPDQMQELIVNYFRERQTVDVPMEAPWRFAPFPSGTTVTFESAPEAAHSIPPGSGISFIEAAPDGFGRFRLDQV